ncbi:unnamed protein product [Toxocara canis]|uniref:Secreted protein n=1 Tax=Toxocara canis TaxID=6265 RepID=A0A183V0W6_TOXCA|nr:unnamed protein product [Toxocara canis]
MTSYFTAVTVALLCLVTLSTLTQLAYCEDSTIGGWTGSAASGWKGSPDGIFGGSSASSFGSGVIISSAFHSDSDEQKNTDDAGSSNQETDQPKIVMIAGGSNVPKQSC